jgi:hypothetical protein
MVPEGAINNVSICVCDFPWSGQTDLLNYDGYDCVDLGILRRVLFGAAALRHCYNLKYMYLAFKCQWRVFQANKGKRRKKGPTINHWWEMLSFKILIANQIANILIQFVG